MCEENFVQYEVIVAEKKFLPGILTSEQQETYNVVVPSL